MRGFKKDIYRSSGEEEDVIVLDPFDYMIVTYKYDLESFHTDLDSATSFFNATTQNGRWVGCGQNNGYITPNNSYGINEAYLYQHGDDNNNGHGESIVVNFKNIRDAGLILDDLAIVELYAGWCASTTRGTCTVSATTYIGGTMSFIENVIVSNGTVANPPANSGDIHCQFGCCSTPPLTGKTHIGTIRYNYLTQIVSVEYYTT